MTNFPKPNYKVWDDVNKLDHLQVICLWAELEPSIKASKQEICNAIHKALEEARMEGLLRSDVVKECINGRLEYNVIFYRKDLMAYAEIIGRKPAFLYPETRTSLDASICTDSSSPPNPAAPPSQAKVENQPDSAIELPKIEDVQKVQGQSSENKQPAISKHEYPEEICDLFDPLSKAKTEDLPDMAIESPKEEVVQNEQSQSNENEQSVISEFEYSKEICDLFDPCSIAGLIEIFPEYRDVLVKAINRASRNGLNKARTRRGKYNPAKIATWIIQKGARSSKVDALLKGALPSRSKHSSIADDYFN